MSTPEFLSTDETTVAAFTRRAAITHHTHVLVGAVIAAAALWLVTDELYGQWVFWTIFALGAVASDALAAALGLLATLTGYADTTADTTGEVQG